MTRFWRRGCFLGLVLVLVAACEVKPAGSDHDGGAGVCSPGTIRCVGVNQERCDDAGSAWVSTPCVEACVEGQGCVNCVEGSYYCDPEDTRQVQRCQDETLVPDHACLEDEGCRLGACQNLCDPTMLARSNEGCEFWAVDLDNWYGADAMNPDASGEQFSVVVTNLNDFAITVVTEINEAEPGDPQVLAIVDQRVVAPLELVQIDLPQREVDGSVLNQNDGTGTALTSHAFRVTSSGPIIAYQFNPIYQMQTNDASILIPTHALDVRYWVMGYLGIGMAVNPINPTSTNYAFMTVVGTQADTQVSITLSADVGPGGPIAAWTPAGSTIEVTLGAFDVLNLEAHCPAGMSSLDCMNSGVTDFTGSLVTSSAPVAVFGGVECITVAAPVGESGCCCDHLEDQIFPTSALGKNFVAAHSPWRGGTEPDLWRVLADYDGTQVTTADGTFTLQAGEYHDFYATVDQVVFADQPIMLAQYLVSQDYTADVTGDPSLTIFPPVEQFRDRYIFLVPATFDGDHAVVVRPSGALVTIDGQAIPGEFSGCTTAVAGTLETVTYEVIRCPMPDGVHRLEADQPVGLVVYGYGPAGSYAFPGGADVRQINVPE
jgi:hypothetical protein